MRDYVPAKVLCRKCMEDDVSIAELADYLDGYVNSLPEDMRTPPDIYEERLRICGECERRTALTCTLCGCYIQTRAAKRHMECPNDKGGPKWRAVDAKTD